jgi:DNA (cytosine-5)-methyltransferase 1
MQVLDLYCGQGGAAAGYRQAGFDVTGVDLDPQARFPYPFHQADAIAWVRQNLDMIRETFSLIHASPPCQHYSKAQRIQDRDHPDLVGPTRDVLDETSLPWVIENVEGSPLLNPIELCGAMFGLRTYRHRLFETGGGFTVAPPAHPRHTAPLRKMGRRPMDGDMIHAVGNFSGVAIVRDDWGVPWMNRNGIRESIPPAYTRYIGEQFSRSRGT